ncbi:MAG: glutathione S-transferase family protein [Alphaproteobacteria bacterium]|jgi:glutathione S-transferase
MTRPIVHHIPVCPFSQRLEILLALKGLTDAVEFRVVDITRPRDPELLAKTHGTTALPALELLDGRIVKESLVILRWIEENHADPMVARTDPYERAVERMLITREGPFTAAGYRFVMNRDRDAQARHRDGLLALHAELGAFLDEHNPDGTWLFDAFGLAEAVFTPMFMRFWFLEYYDGFELPDKPDFARIRRWRDACLAHPAAQQVCREEIVKLYYDYALGSGNGALPPGRRISSFAFEPHWTRRPWPPRDKFAPAGDAALGLVADRATSGCAQR